MNIRSHVVAMALAVTGMVCIVRQASATSAELDELRSQVTRQSAPFVVKDADLRVKISQAVFTRVAGVFSSLPADKRQASFNGISKTGNVWNQGGGFAGCGAFAEINNGGRDFHFTVGVGGLDAKWQPDGHMNLHLNVAANFWGTVHGHVRGPAGMCSGPSFTYPLGRWSCDCPIGGGAGTVVGISANKGSAFDGYLTLNPQPDGQISYAVVLTSPQSISVTVSAGLQNIGTVGFPASFALPSSPLLQGTIVGVVKNEGLLKIGGTDKPYALTVTNVHLKPDVGGLELLADAHVTVPAAN